MFHMYTDTCIQSCTLSSQRQRQHSCVSLWLWDGEKAKEKERGSSCWWEWTEQLQRHTDRSLWKERITCARLLSCHILIPGWAHLETNLRPSTQHRAPLQSPPATHPPIHPPVIQACSCQHFHLCTVLVWCQVHTHKHTHTFTKATPTTGLPHVCQERQVGWRGH